MKPKVSIERKAMSALRWAAGAKLVVQLVSWAGTLIVVRLLSPDDYGLMAKVAVVCGLVGIVAELGLEAAIVQSKEIGDVELRKLFGISLLFAIAATALVIAAAPLLAVLLHAPELTGPVRVASLQIVIAALATVPVALATRWLSFQRLAMADMLAGVTNIGVTLALALVGAGVWALVLGMLSGAAVRSATMLLSVRSVRPLLSTKGIGEQLKFGLTLVSSRLSAQFVVQSDVLVGSRLLTTAEIGQYAVALQLATLPMTKVMGTVNQILMAAVARRQSEPLRVHDALLRSIRFIALAGFAIFWGISATAPEIVQVLFGQAWLAAIPALMLLPLIVPLRIVCSVIFTVSLAMGNRNLDLRNTIVNLAVIPVAYFIGAHWGLVGLCAASLVSVPLVYSFTLPVVLRRVGIRGVELLTECALPAAAGGVMYVAVHLLRSELGAYAAIVRLAALVAAGAVVYLAIVAIAGRRHLRTARDFFRSFVAPDTVTPIE